jgi:hypothetical protein
MSGAQNRSKCPHTSMNRTLPESKYERPSIRSLVFLSAFQYGLSPRLRYPYLLSFFLELLAKGYVVCRRLSRVSGPKLRGRSDTRLENERAISKNFNHEVLDFMSCCEGFAGVEDVDVFSRFCRVSRSLASQGAPNWAGIPKLGTMKPRHWAFFEVL